MKSPLTICLLTLVLFSFIACTKETSKEKGDGTANNNENFYATSDGNPWNADSLQLIQVSSNGVTISGLSKTGEEISINLPEFKTGTYTLNAQSVSYAIDADLLGSLVKVYVSNSGTASGTVTITNIDTVNRMVSGTFQFNLVDPTDNSTKTITRGVFSNIPYSGDPGGIITPPPIGNGGPDTLQATIDNNPFFGSQTQTVDSSGQLFLAGISSDGNQTVALIMPDNITPGTYNLDFGTGLYIGIYYTVSVPGAALVSQSNGKLTIISNDTAARRIIGTFSFVASPITSGTPVTITNGYFSISY